MASRRKLLACLPMASLLALLVACAPAPSSPTSTSVPKAAEKPAATAIPKEAEKPAATPIGQTAEKPAAKPTDNFYAGKTIRVVVGSSTGGQYDGWARLLARHMPKYIPGNPTMVVENMPGAGGMVAANYMYNVAPRDGTVISTFASGMVTNQLIGTQGVQYEMQKFNWLGAVANTTNVCIATERSGVTSFEDILPPKRKQVIFGSSGPGTNSHDYPLLLNALLDANIKMVSGYQGNNEVRLAIEKGEVDGYCVVWETAKALHQPWIDAGQPKFNYIVQFAFQKHPELPNVPNAYEVLKNDEDRAVLKLLLGPDQFFWPFAAPPGVPADRVAILRKALADAFRDPDLNAEAERAKWVKNPQTGEQIDAYLKDLMQTPESAARRYKQLVGR